MMRRFAFLLAFCCAGTVAPAVAQPMLLPTPAKLTPSDTGFVLAPGTPLIASDAGERNAAARLTELMASQGVRLGAPSSSNAARIAVRFTRTPGITAEGYKLVVDRNGATINAADDAGLLYGAVTLWQLASQTQSKTAIAGVTIDDAPRFGWRGLMLDSARHFQSPEYIRHLIDWMMASKLNRLHWHLVDDQGWRIPIAKYPRLTSVSGWRRPATAPGAPPLPPVGGAYTHAQIREIVTYAAARGITVVPEIEMPGHALAAIRAYPKLGMGVPIPPGTEAHWGVFPWLYNTKDATFGFLQDVLREVMGLFPSKWIHVGGDEAVKDQWRASPAIQAQIKRLALKDEDALQGWFMARIGRFLAANGRKLVGWDEVLDGGVPPDATITSWRGIEGAVKAARLGHDAILSPAPTLYLDNRQGTGPSEPPGRGRLITLADVLAFEPVPKELSANERRHILGLQANLWTEHVRTEERAAWMMFPRAAAIAEIGWAAESKRSLPRFLEQLAPQLDRLAPLGLRAANSAFAVTAKVDRRPDGKLVATLANQSDLPIAYTVDGTPPDVTSERYSAPFVVKRGQTLNAVALLGDRVLSGGQSVAITETATRTRTSHELTLCSDEVALDLEDDFPATGTRPRYLLDIFNPCWRWNGAPVEDARTIVLSVGQLPFNFQVGADREKIRFRSPVTPAGEFEVRAGSCEGTPIVTLPLGPAVRNPGVTRLEAQLPARLASRDLCFTYTARSVDPLWAVQRVDLLP